MTADQLDECLALTPGQRRLWALAQLRPGDPFFSIPFAVGIDGPLDATALGRALDELVARHPALRVRIVRGEDGEPVQRVRPAGALPSPAAEPEDVTEAEADALAEEFAATPFDVDGGPLLRVRLLRLGDTAHRLLVGVHHIVFDGASLEVFVSELAALYGAFAEGAAASPLPEPAVAYGAFLASRTAQDDQDRPENLRYWTGLLAGAPEVLELPLTGPRRAGAGHAGARRTTVIPYKVVEPLRRLARARRCSLYMVLKAATDVVLSRYGTADVLTGMAVSGRDTVESSGLVGYLTRPVVLRGDLSDDPEFGELLGRVRGDLLDALDHSDLPVDEVMDRLGIARDPSHHPIYQVMYTHQPAPPVHQAGGVAFRAGELRLPTMKTDLAIDTVETEDGGLLALVDYRTDLLDEATADLLLSGLRTVLERAGADPSARVSALLRPTEAERRRLVEEWNPYALAVADEECAHGLVAAQAARTPDAVAVAAGPRTWTYRELDAAAEALAARLRGLGVGPEVRVGVCAPLSFGLVAAQLAVWKAGGVCVPLDAGLPAFLLRLAVDDAELDTVLADAVSFALFDHTRVRVVELDAAAGTDPGAATGTGTAAGPRHAALVLRTSGATGEPLGVVVEHRQLASRLRWALRELPAEALEAVVPLGPPDAAGAVVELLAPLVAGGRVVLPDGDAASGTVYVAPSRPTELPGVGVTYVVTGGEPVVGAQVRAAYDAGAKAVHHVYAAAETAGPALGGPVDAGGPDGVAALGVPAGATAYVLDGAGRLVPPGVVGELHIGGAAVTRGYVGRPALTADRFRPDPFAAEPGARLFATGDLARYTPGGRLEFVGRASEQVRVRGGVRVAAQDVRATLLAHPGVARAEVLTAVGAEGGGAARAADSGPAGRSAAEAAGLVAAVVAKPGAELSVAGLRAHLVGWLPGYMQPALLEVLDRVPSLPSGRADRAALLAAVDEAAAQREAAADERPANAVEVLVSQAWEQVLGRAVGPETGFFDAGGNSLLLIRLRDRLREALGREVEVIDLFRHSTVRAMAAHFGGPEPTTGGPEPAPGGADRGQARQQALRARARARTTRTQGRSR